MPKHSAGILLYRLTSGVVDVLLAHPGGPFWAKKNIAAWSIPKGEFDENENPLDAAKREFAEETGLTLPPAAPFLDLGALKQPTGKIIHAFAAQGDCDPSAIKSNTFKMEWPPKSGTLREFPEIDRAAWFPAPLAKQKLHKGQSPFIDLLLEKLDSRSDNPR